MAAGKLPPRRAKGMGTPENPYDVLVIGGGASGLACALSAARAGAAVAVLDRDVACGMPILATGNGRCNYSNENLDPSHYLHPDVAARVMGPEPEAGIDALFSSLGLVGTSVGGWLYPLSRRAESVRDVLVAGCVREGATLLPAHAVRSAARTQDGTWRIAAETPLSPLPRPKTQADEKRLRKTLRSASKRRVELCSRTLVLAAGGGTADLASSLGLTCEPETPVLCPLACDCPFPVPLDGLRVHAKATLVRNGVEVAAEQGEVLFRTYGLSGIAVFNLSRKALPGDIVELDLACRASEKDAQELFENRARALGAPSGPEWYRGMFADSLARTLWRLAETEGSLDAASLAHLACHVPFPVKGPARTTEAQVTRGGVRTDRLDLDTLESTETPGLFCCGEAVDMDADCGGYNLAWAWLSGMRAGKGAAAVSARASERTAHTR